MGHIRAHAQFVLIPRVFIQTIPTKDMCVDNTNWAPPQPTQSGEMYKAI